MKAIDQAIEEVNNTLRPSIWSKNDVLNLLAEANSRAVQEDSNASSAAPFDMEEFKDKLRERLERAFNNLNGSDVVDMSSATFEINGGNSISIENDSIDVNTSELLDTFDTAFDDVAGNFLIFDMNQDND